ncbi:apolipoprotein N-acyltransferase [Parvularcula sp. IMCC14364]|uniref:apolipoprotein N-acyltransferase n=1 Tax=Parvularcula sp. IMCC14364 TaxID=3067902 RepID=UPI002740EB2E|nr:apolipoprotein N-acyltransferase [Parvularcula sp. IMCC14364]
MSKLRSLLISAHAFSAGLSGWRRYGLAFLLGVLTALTMAPYYLLPLLVVGFSGFVWLMDAAGRAPSVRRVSFMLGWWFAFGYLYLSLYWMAFSFVHTASDSSQAVLLLVMGFAGVAGLAGFIALFYGAAALVMRQFWTDDWTRVLVLVVLWSIAEYARGHVLTGLPWNLTGQAFAGVPALAQPAAWIGPYGLGVLVLMLAVLPALSVGRSGSESDYQHLSVQVSFRPIAIVAAGFSVMLIFGITRLALNPVVYHPDIKVQVVQPNVAQADKINPALFPQNFLAAFNLSGGEALERLEPDEELYIIWPENAAYDYFQRDQTALDLLQEALPVNAVLVSGAIRIEQKNPDTERFYNSLHVIRDMPVPDNLARSQLQELGMETRRRMIVNSYDKHHLAPFGEYVPLIGLFRALGIDKLVPLNNGLSRGNGPSVLNIGKTLMAPVICYETIFPGRMYPEGQRPDWMVTVTNDAWFGDSVGPKQHLAQARLRSIETGLPMVRSANTGISAIIGPAGRILDRIPLQESGTVFSRLPQATGRTLYDRLGDIPYFLMILILCGVVLRYRLAAKQVNSA